MGRFKDAMIEDMNIRQVSELVNKHRGNNDLGYVKFLEEELKKSEQKIINIRKLQSMKVMKRSFEGPGYCVECFKLLPKNEIICGRCQDEMDGRWDNSEE
jgi:hypothetical protein